MRLIALTLLLAILATSVFALDPIQFNFQGRLLGNNGNPVPDGDYNLIFRIFPDSMSGNLLWEETHLSSISEGLFNVELGSVNPCSIGVFNLSQLYLEIQVGDLPPLNSRMRLGSAPRSGSSQRVSGDIITMPGIVRVFDPQPEPPGSVPLMELRAVEGSSTFKMFDPQPEPPGIEASLINLSGLPDAGSLEFFAPATGGAALVNGNPQIKISCSNIRSDLLLQRAWGDDLSPGDSIGIYMSADSLRSYLALYDNNATQVKMGSVSGAGYSTFFNDGSIYMGVEPSPFGGGVIRMHDEIGDTSIELTSEGAARFLRDGSEYMGIEPSPWHLGGDLTMHNPVGNQTMILSSTGSASFLRDGTEYMGVEPSPFLGGTLKMYGLGEVSLVLSSSGRIGIGTESTPNILTVVQNSSTDPIADAWTTYSSRRWKTNIQPLQGALEKVMRLNGVTFDWIERGKHDIGLIAEDVGQVVPEVVAYEENGVDAQSVDYARLTALLIEAVKEQQKTIEELKTEIGDIKIELKNKQASLEPERQVN